jgi:hypothetical protein
MQAEVGDALKKLVGLVDLDAEPPELAEGAEDCIKPLAEVVVRARSTVTRDGSRQYD